MYKYALTIQKYSGEIAQWVHELKKIKKYFTCPMHQICVWLCVFHLISVLF